MDTLFKFLHRNQGNSGSWSTIFRQFFTFYILTAIVLSLLFYGVLKVNAIFAIDMLRAKELAQVKIATHLLAYDIEITASDLRVLAKQSSLKKLLLNNDPNERQNLIEHYLALSDEVRMYHQILAYNSQGIPVIGVEFINDKARQVKQPTVNPATRAYILNASRLKPGEVSISPLTPDILFTTPVFDSNNKYLGAVSISFIGKKLLTDFQDAMGASHHPMLLNTNGNLLNNFPQANPLGLTNFSKDYPQEWQKILSRDTGYLHTRNGLFIFSTVYPLIAAQTAADVSSQKKSFNLQKNPFFWKLVSFVPTKELLLMSFTHDKIIFLMYVLSLFLLAALIFYLVKTLDSRRKLHKELIISEERFRNAMDNAPIGMAIVSRDGYFIKVNSALSEIVGYGREELEKLSFNDINDASDLAEVINKIELLLAGKIRSFRIENRFVRKNGSMVWVQLTGSLLTKNTEKKEPYFIAQMEDITERKKHQGKIHQLAYHDQLTHLANRQLLLDRLQQSLDQAKRHHRSVAVIFLDLDKFKVINDSLGHNIGDQLLKHVAVRLSSAVRGGDTVARLGGDEFVIILTEIHSPEAAGIVSKKILNGIAEKISIDVHELYITASIGIAVYPDDGLDSITLIKNADAAMYIAKQEGRNQLQYFSKISVVKKS